MAKDLTPTSIASHVEEIVRKHVESSAPIPLDADLINDLAMDSLELVELGLKLEKQFEIKLPISEIRRCITLEDVIQLVFHTHEEQHLEKFEHA